MCDQGLGAHVPARATFKKRTVFQDQVAVMNVGLDSTVVAQLHAVGEDFADDRTVNLHNFGNRKSVDTAGRLDEELAAVHFSFDMPLQAKIALDFDCPDNAYVPA